MSSFIHLHYACSAFRTSQQFGKDPPLEYQAGFGRSSKNCQYFPSEITDKAIVEIILQQTYCTDFPLTHSQGTIHKYPRIEPKRSRLEGWGGAVKATCESI